MDIQNNPYLNAASRALQNGEPEQAVSILTAILANDAKNAEAWFLLSAVVEKPSAVAACLRNVLALDPNHEGALKMREQLEQQYQLKPLAVMQINNLSAAHGLNCPYCRSLFKDMDEVVDCPKCQVTHHFHCWQENGHACAAMLCEGFSLQEHVESPLPIQPALSEPKVVVIRKEDLAEVKVVSRKEKEQRFQRRLLMLALMKEEGQMPDQYAPDLPSVDELLDQIQRDRTFQKQQPGQKPPTQQAAQLPEPNLELTPLVQDIPLPYQSSGLVTGVISIWPQAVQAAAPISTTEVCSQCGYQFQHGETRFCPQCGAAQ